MDQPHTPRAAAAHLRSRRVVYAPDDPGAPSCAFEPTLAAAEASP